MGFGTDRCKITEISISIACFLAGIVSLISLAVLSYERYSTLTLCHKRSDDFRKALLAVGGSWIYSLVWTVPPLLGWSSYGVEGAGTSCSVRWSSESAESTSYIVCLFIFCLVVPVMVMMYCYGRLLYAVKQVSSSCSHRARCSEPCLHFPLIKFGSTDGRESQNEIEKTAEIPEGRSMRSSPIFLILLKLQSKPRDDIIQILILWLVIL